MLCEQESMLTTCQNTTIQYASASTAMSSTECTTIYKEVKNNLLGKIEKLIKDIVAKKDTFRAIGALSLVKKDLSRLQGLFVTLGHDFTSCGVNIEPPFHTMSNDFGSAASQFSS
jgi:hypothetical protein